MRKANNEEIMELFNLFHNPSNKQGRCKVQPSEVAEGQGYNSFSGLEHLCKVEASIRGFNYTLSGGETYDKVVELGYYTQDFYVPRKWLDKTGNIYSYKRFV